MVRPLTYYGESQQAIREKGHMVLDIELEPGDSASGGSVRILRHRPRRCARRDRPRRCSGVAFLDRRPLLPGHVLLVPRSHVATLPDLPVSEVGPLFALAQRLTRAVPRATGADGALLAVNDVVSQSVPHLHVHVVPRRHDDRLFSRNLAWTRHSYRDDDDMRQVAAAIRGAL